MRSNGTVKWKALLGFGFCSGKIISGTEATRSLLKGGQVRLVWLAEDASSRTKKAFLQLCKERATECVVFSQKEILGLCTGQSPRAVLAIMDQQLAEAILRVIRPGRLGK